MKSLTQILEDKYAAKTDTSEKYLQKLQQPNMDFPETPPRPETEDPTWEFE
ncbi:MAG: hypothetical protein ACRBDI_09350 [Alphaproteobacteria bacterium]